MSVVYSKFNGESENGFTTRDIFPNTAGNEVSMQKN